MSLSAPPKAGKFWWVGSDFPPVLGLSTPPKVGQPLPERNSMHTSSRPRQRFLVLEGEGANGKSVVCGILADLLGRQNVSHVPLERFGDRFQLTMTLGKLANIAAGTAASPIRSWVKRP